MPNITNAYVGSSKWTTAFRSMLIATVPGATQYGVPLPSFTNTLRTPWANLDQITLVTDIASRPTAQSLLIYSGSGGGGVKQFTNYDNRGFVWTFNNAFRGGVNISISQRDIAIGTPEPLPPNTIAFNPTWNLNVKVGDANRDGQTNAADTAAIKAALGTSTTVRPNVYNVLLDLDGDGKVAANDLVLMSAT